jgi:hypothetical protein
LPHVLSEIKQGPRNAGQRNAASRGSILGMRAANTVYADAAKAPAAAAGRRDMDSGAGVGEQPPHGGGTAVTQERFVAAGKYGGKQVAEPSDARLTDRVDSWVEEVKPAGGEPAIDRAAAEADCE